MEKIFLSVLNMSLTASFIIVVIMLARLPLKKAPKIISYALWAIAGFRLVFPFTLESVFSLLPFKATPIPQDIAMQAVPRIDSGIAVIDNAISAALPAATPYSSVNPLQVEIFIYSSIWLLGVAVMLVYSFVSIVLLRHRLRGAALIEGNLYEADNLKTPFVIGLFRPKIYIPAGLTNEERHYIILHEQTHIRRHDHAVKMLAYFILCLHWFNPLAWAAFILMGADMEMSCDERVIKELGGDIKNAYSLSLVRVASGRKILNGSPLAFGEGGMKERIKNVLNFKKHSRAIIIAAVVLAAVLSVGFAVNRADKPGLTSSALAPSNEPPRVYYLENYTEKDSFERLISVTVYSDGKVEFTIPPISSYILPECTTSITNDELLIHAIIKTEFDEGFFGVKNDDVIAKFKISDDGNMLVFMSSTVPLLVDEGARYVLKPVESWQQIHIGTPIETVHELLGEPSGFTSGLWSEFFQIDDNTTVQYHYRENENLNGVVYLIFLNGKQIEPWQKDVTLTPAKWTPSQSIGADFPHLDYAGMNIEGHNWVIFHGYFGLFVYDLDKQDIVYSLDLKTIGCDSTQGDAYCEVMVSDFGDTITLHPMNSETMFVLNLWDSEKRLFETPVAGNENYIFPFKTVSIEEAFPDVNFSTFPFGSYSSQAVEFESSGGKYFGYLYTGDWTLDTLSYIVDDEVYTLFQ